MFDEYQDQQNRLEEIEKVIHTFSSIIYDNEIHYRYCRIWLIVGLGVMVWYGRRVKKQLKEQQNELKKCEKRLEEMEKWVEGLQKQVILATVKQEEIVVKREPVKKENEKMKKMKKKSV